MSSKPETDRRAWSLAARLTVWYAGTAFVLVALVTAFRAEGGRERRPVASPPPPVPGCLNTGEGT